MALPNDIVWDAPNDIVWDNEKPRRTYPQELLRQGGLGVRALVEGAAAIPGMFINPFQQAAGNKTMSQATADLLTRAGLPVEETSAEKLSGAISRAMTGGGVAAGAARAIPAMAGAAPEIVNNIMAQNAGTQIAQAGIGGGASELTRQAGGGEGAQMLAGAVAPMAAQGAWGIGSAAARGAREVLRPVTKAGSEQIAADVLGRVVEDKASSIANIKRYEELRALGEKFGVDTTGVAGVRPTSGAVTKDYGLIGAEQLAARKPDMVPEFARRLGNNNAAIADELAKLNLDQVAAMEAKRETITAPLREAAFAKAKGPVDFGPVAQKIIDLTQTPEGTREQSKRAIDWLAAKVKWYTDNGYTSPQYADALRKDIGDLVAGKISDDKGSVRLAAGLANSVKKTLAEEIDKAAPGFSKYLETYAKLSRPIDRAEVIAKQFGGEDMPRVTNALPVLGDSTEGYRISQSKLKRVADNLNSALPVDERGLPLGPYKTDIINRVMGELNAQEIAARGGKPPGSDTFQNMATQGIFRNILGDEAAKAGLPKMVEKPMAFLYSPLEQRIQDTINRAYLDPQLMRKLLEMARTRRHTMNFGDIGTSAGQNIYGGLLGQYAGAAGQ